MIENAVHKQLKLVGLATPDSPDVRTLVAKVDDIVFAITRTPAVVSAIGNLRNLDLAHVQHQMNVVGRKIGNQFMAVALK